MQDSQQTQPVGTDIATLPPADRAVIVLGSKKAEKELRDLIAKSAGIVSIIDSAGREEAHRAGMTLKNARIAIEKTGKAARDDATKFSKAVIAEEQRLVAIVTPEEERVLALRDAFDAKAKAEKEEAERRERERVAGIKTKIAGILNLPATSYRDSAADLQTLLDDLAALEPTEAMFAEFAGEAADAKAQAMAGLRDLLTKAQAAEAEAKRLEDERAELQRIQAEAAQRRHEEEERQKAAAAAIAAQERELAEKKAAAEKELADKMAELERQRAEFDAKQKLAQDHEEALAHNAQFDLGSAMAADMLDAAHDEALAINAARPQPTRKDIENATDEEIADYAAIRPGEVFTHNTPEWFRPEPSSDLKAGIEMLCTAVQNLRALGMDNESILVTAGEALEAIDAKEAA